MNGPTPDQVAAMPVSDLADLSSETLFHLKSHAGFRLALVSNGGGR